MPGTEVTITTGGTGEEVAIPNSDAENLYDAGPYGGGRVGGGLIGEEQAIVAQ